MKLTMKGEYALRAMIALAQSPDGSMTISQIAEAKAIPRKFLEQILLALKGGGLLTSRAGPKGGYVLVVQPAAITAAAILRAVEEPISTGIYRMCSYSKSSGSTAHTWYRQGLRQEVLLRWKRRPLEHR